jgi:hypothetical protein
VGGGIAPAARWGGCSFCGVCARWGCLVGLLGSCCRVWTRLVTGEEHFWAALLRLEVGWGKLSVHIVDLGRGWDALGGLMVGARTALAGVRAGERWRGGSWVSPVGGSLCRCRRQRGHT